MGFEITIIVRGKHAELYRLACEAGSQKNLAEAMGSSVCMLNRWINLKDYPRRITEDLRSNILLVTGKTCEELFPQEVKDWIDNNNGRSLKLEVNQELQLYLNDNHAKRMMLADPADVIEQVEVQNEIKEALRFLTQREQSIIELRFGLNGNNHHTLSEAATAHQVTRERIRQIESKAIRKLQRPSVSKKLGESLGIDVSELLKASQATEVD